MLFDLRGKRKRLIQVTYVFLALIFVVGFIGFGVGVGGGPGGIFDAITGGGHGSSSSAFNSAVKQARKDTSAHPSSEQAWLGRVQADFNFLLQAGVDRSTGALNDQGQQAIVDVVASWERYLKLHPKKVNGNVAGAAARSYLVLGDVKKAFKTQKYVVKSEPNAPTAYADLALYAYAAGQDALARQATNRAVAKSPKDQRNTAKGNLKSIAKQGKQIAKQIAARKKASKPQKGQPAGQQFGPLPGQGSLLGAQ